MAHVTLCKNQNVKGVAFPFFYNVGRAVGPGCPNDREDVLLIQYFLKAIYDRADRFHPPLEAPAGAGMKVDGIAGPITFRWIRAFQQEGKRRGHPVLVDGKMNRATAMFGPVTRTRYSIIELSACYLEARPADFPNISTALDCPPALGSAVSV